MHVLIFPLVGRLVAAAAAACAVLEAQKTFCVHWAYALYLIIT